MVSIITEYVSYFEAGEDMTDEEYGIYMRAIHNFAYRDIEPDYSKFTPLVKAALRTVIASVRKNKKDRENGKTGGRPSKKTGFSENEKGGYFISETNGKENEKEKDDGNANNGDTSALAPSSLTAPQENYSKQVFELFKTAGLPCQNGDLFRFQCVDFKNSLQKLKGYSSAEVLQTIKNYIYELQHPDSWHLPQLSFSSFVGSRTWEKCTPANYRHENFLDFKKQKGRNTAPEIKEHLEKCPACGKESLKLIENGLKYKCQDCGKIYTWEEINL